MAIVSPVTRDHGVYRAKDKVLQFTVTDRDGTVVDISGWALAWGLWRKGEGADKTATVTKTTGDGISITDGPSGECQVTLTKADLTQDPGEWQHELRRTDAGLEDDLVGPSPFFLLASPST